MASMREPLVLASASAARARLLRAVGLECAIVPADIDEAAIKRAFRRDGGAAAACALALAEAKAASVATRCPCALVIGADQLLVADDTWFDKPVDRMQAHAQLRALRGRTHELATAACVVCGSVRLWQAINVPRLTMRGFSEAFLEAYLETEGQAVVGSVGGYRIEGRGAQLFSRIEGDHFAIQGLPLIELLEFLRHRGALPS
jgi:nucleoside triphosphate pyrophosphatase